MLFLLSERNLPIARRLYGEMADIAPGLWIGMNPVHFVTSDAKTFLPYAVCCLPSMVGLVPHIFPLNEFAFTQAGALEDSFEVGLFFHLKVSSPRRPPKKLSRTITPNNPERARPGSAPPGGGRLSGPRIQEASDIVDTSEDFAMREASFNEEKLKVCKRRNGD